MSSHVLPWYTREEWVKVRSICSDPDTMLASYDLWLDAAKKGADKAKADSVTVHKVYIVADALAMYSKRHNKPLTSDTRVAYAIELYTGTV
jgi:hypothetical protein